MVLVAAALFGFNGAVAKVALSSGVSSLRLTEVRCAGAFVGLALIAVLRDRASLRPRPGEWRRLALFGVVGVAWVQLFYFLAINRLAIGIALLIQYLGPLLVAIWARTFGHEHVRRRVWAALGLSLAGLVLMVRLWSGVSLDGLGVVFALVSAFVFAAYLSSPSTRSASATRSRCSPGASCSRRCSGRSCSRGGASPRRRSGAPCRSKGTSRRGTCPCGRSCSGSSCSGRSPRSG